MAYDSERVIWGVAKTFQKAMSEARHWQREQEGSRPLMLCQCTERLRDAVDDGGIQIEGKRWRIEEGIADLVGGAK
jgi:hypothetical protein